MSTNEQDRTDGAGCRLALSDKRGDNTTAMVVTQDGGYVHLDVTRRAGASEIEVSCNGVRAVTPIPDAALDTVLAGLLHMRDVRDREAEGGAVISALRGTPDGESLAVAADMDREGRAA